MDKKVALIIPIFNVETYLRECLESLIHQSYKNLSIILIDDGSTDSSLDIAKEYARNDDRIIIITKLNGGQSSARNAALTYLNGGLSTNFIKDEEGLKSFELSSKADEDKVLNVKELLSAKENLELQVDYIQFVDSDDYIELHCVSECVKRMQGVDIVWTDTKPFYDGVKDTQWLSPLKWLDYNEEQILSRDDFLTRIMFKKQYFFHFAAAAGMISFRFLQRIGLQFINFIVQEDDYFGILLFAQAQSIYVFPKKMYHYRIRKNSIMNYGKNINKDTIPIFFRKYLQDFNHDIKATKEYLHTSSAVKTALGIVEFLNACKCAYTKAVIEKYLLPTYIRNAFDILYSPNDPLNLIPHLKELEAFSPKGVSRKIQAEIPYQIGSYLLSLKNFKDFFKGFGVILKMLNSYKKFKKIYKERIEKFPFAKLKNSSETKEVQKHLSYRLGKAIVRANEKWYLFYLFLPFEFLWVLITFRISKIFRKNAYKLLLQENKNLHHRLNHLQYLVYQTFDNPSNLQFMLEKMKVSLCYEGIFIKMLESKERKICVDFSVKEGNFLDLALFCKAFVYAYEGSFTYYLLQAKYKDEKNISLKNAYLCSKNSNDFIDRSSKNGLGLVPALYWKKQNPNFIYFKESLDKIFSKEERIYLLKLEINCKNYTLIDELLENEHLGKIDFIFLQIQELFKTSRLYENYKEKLSLLANIIDLSCD